MFRQVVEKLVSTYYQNRGLMKPNLSCNLCGTPIYRCLSEIKQSKSGLFFCSYEHKSIHSGGDQYNIVPHESKIFDATLKANKIIAINQAEYLTDIDLYNPFDINVLSPYITANAKINGRPNLCGKTPEKMSYIRDCFNMVRMKDIQNLPMIENSMEWKNISLRYWDDNNITYEIWE